MAGYEGGFTGAINSANLRGMYQQQVAQMQQAQMRAAIEQRMKQDALQMGLADQANMGASLPALVAPPRVPPGVGVASVKQRPAIAQADAPTVIPAPLGQPATPPYEAVGQKGFRGDPNQILDEIANIPGAGLDPGDREKMLAQFKAQSPASFGAFQREPGGAFLNQPGDEVAKPPVPEAAAPAAAAPAAAAPASPASQAVDYLKLFVEDQVSRGVTGAPLARSVALAYPILNKEAQSVLRVSAQENQLLKTQLDFVMKKALLPIKQQTADAGTAAAGAKVTTAAAATRNADTAETRAATAATRAGTAERQGDERLAQRQREFEERQKLEREKLAERAKAQAGKPTQTDRQHYMDSNQLLKAVARVETMLNNPATRKKIDDSRVANFFSDVIETKTIQQFLVRPNLDPDVKTYLAEVANLRNQYYLDMSGKAVTGGEALRNYGAVMQPSDTADDVMTKMGVAKTRANEKMRDLETYFPSLSVIKGKPAGEGGAGTGAPIPTTAVTGRRAGDNGGGWSIKPIP